MFNRTSFVKTLTENLMQLITKLNISNVFRNVFR